MTPLTIAGPDRGGDQAEPGLRELRLLHLRVPVLPQPLHPQSVQIHGGRPGQRSCFLSAVNKSYAQVNAF